jgi:hypothetical protein
MKKIITAETTISHAILQKGDDARDLINQVLCGGASVCCCNTSLQLGHASKTVDKAEALSGLLTMLNGLSDLPAPATRNHVHTHQRHGTCAPVPA